MTATHPIEGDVVLQAGAFASVPLHAVNGLIDRVQQHIDDHRAEYERQFERIDGDGRHYYMPPSDYWQDVAEELLLDDSEIDAVRRAHETQFRRDGRELARSEEFEATLQIRAPVAVDPR